MKWAIEPVSAGDEQSVAAVYELWTAYWTALGLPFGFQGFGEELRSLPGKYQSPAGCLLLSRRAEDRQPAATAAFRPLGAPAACEAKRLHVHPSFRRLGLAPAMLTRLIAEARACGYEWMYGDTLPSMQPALRLYRELGFSEVGP
ncbi:MAG: GNAT family N-acetyltransferase [Acidobacteria bacterium]|nr:GNAT family N-acetyltransferase [Acidobacteriota bacterium]